MEEDNVPRGVVDPEVRAYIYSLVSALGGTGADEDGRYVLGDDALACLKDLKRWLKLYDEKTNRFDVARCLAEANLVKGDLIEILMAWPEDATKDRIMSKIALACLELLVPLTWPIERNELQTTVNHHRHIPYLQLAQISYKREILEHNSSAVLHTAVRIGLPSIALSSGERGPRDEGIIKLLLYFFRNVVMISAPPNLPVEWNEEDVSRSATIDAFHNQGVFALLLTISSNMGEDFNTQDVVVLELLFHMLKGVEIEKLFVNETQLKAKKSNELQELMVKEAAMQRGYVKTAPTRHNRFGTMIWVKRDDERVSSVSGQDVLSNSQHTFARMDQTKKWNRPKQHGKNSEQSQNSFDIPAPLTVSARNHLRNFIEEFLDSSFNPLFNHLRRAIEREADRVLDIHSQHFFYLVSWFLEAERVRRKTAKERNEKNAQSRGEVFEPDSFGLVASVLNQETFVQLNRFMQDRLDTKEWQEVNAGTRCFTQVLHTVQEMADSTLEEDQDIAENIQNRIFYEETTHDRIIAILRGYKDQGFSYLDATTQLSHVFLRMLERYSKENVDLQIRSRRRARRKKKTATMTQLPEAQDSLLEQDSEIEDVAEAQRVSKERKFDFTRFSSKFLTQSCIDTFVTFTTYFKDLTTEQLKRAHRFFYRVAFKRDMSVMLYRLDIIALFNRMIKGPEGLNTANPMFREWDELTMQLNKRMVKKLQQRPELAIELLFSKISSTVFYLEYGYEKQTITSKLRAPVELEVKGDLPLQEQIKIAAAVIHLADKSGFVQFVKDTLISAAIERQSWETEAEARRLLTSEAEPSTELTSQKTHAPSILVKPDTDERKTALMKDNKLQLLMRLAGFERVGVDDEATATWVVPPALTSSQLQETQNLIENQDNYVSAKYGDGDLISLEEMLVRRRDPRPRAEFDDESEGDSTDHMGEEFLFPKNNPVPRRSDVLAELRKKRRRRRRETDSEGEGIDSVDDMARRAKQKARVLADLERRRKLKSDILIHSSDEEDNEDRDTKFFAKEAERRLGQTLRVLKALEVMEEDSTAGATTRKRERPAVGDREAKRARYTNIESESDEDELPRMTDEGSSPRNEIDISTSEHDTTDTPPSSPQNNHLKEVQVNRILLEQNRHTFKSSGVSPFAEDDEDEDDEESLLPTSSRMRGRAAFLDESDGE